MQRGHECPQTATVAQCRRHEDDWHERPRVQTTIPLLPGPLADAVARGKATTGSSIRVTHTTGAARAMVTMLADGDAGDVPILMLLDDGHSEFGKSRNPVLTLSAFETSPARLAELFRVMAAALDVAEGKLNEINSDNGKV